MAARPITLDRAAGFTWRSLVVALGVYVLVLALARLRLLVLPVLIALLLATVLVPLVDRLVARGLPRLAATWIVVLGSLTVLVGLFAALAPSVMDEFGDLGPTLSEGRESAEQFILDSPFDISQADLDRYVGDLGDRLQGRGEQIASGVAAGAVVAVEVVAGILLLLVLLFFFVKDGPVMTAFFLRQVREDDQDLARALGRRAWTTASAYLRGTAIVAFVDALIIGIGLVVIGVPLVLPLALLTFIGGFFPLVGATAAGVVAALVALVDGGLRDALLVTGLIIVVQQVEGDVLQPLVLGRAVRLHPVVVLGALTAGAVLGGLAGAFLGVPTAAVAVALATELRERRLIGPPGADAAEGAPASPPEPAEPEPAAD